MLLMLQEAQLLHIRTIEQMFQNTEETLQDLLSAVGRAPVALRARHTDVQDADQWLRWEVFPQWLPAGRTPVDYRNPPNTAELIILHLLLATSALVSATSPRGRMLILDESGNNLDAPNLRRVSQALRQIADKYGLTMVLACQDLYTSLVSERSTGMIQLVRTSPEHVLNAAPVVLQEEDDPVLARSLQRYLQMGRPTGHTRPA
jgi:chromosome segregation protein